MSTLTFATYKKAHKTNTLVFSYAPNFFNILTFSIFCGADGSRTRVQTRNQSAFYMLIFAFGFRASARPKPPTNALSAKISHTPHGRHMLSPILPHHFARRFRAWLLSDVLSQHLVPRLSRPTIIRLGSKSVVILASYSLPDEIKVLIRQCTACLRITSTRCQNQAAPYS